MPTEVVPLVAAAASFVSKRITEPGKASTAASFLAGETSGAPTGGLQPAPVPPPIQAAPAPGDAASGTQESKGVQDEAVLRSRALRRRKQRSLTGGLFDLSTDANDGSNSLG